MNEKTNGFFYLKRSLRNNKAQITVFIIIGIIILIGVIIFNMIRKEVIEGELMPDVELSIEEVPIEFTPVDSFVKGCIQEIAEEGTRKLGNQGGFISPNRYGIITTEEPTESDAVKRSPTADYSIPYWFYLKSPNNCFGQCNFVSVPNNILYLHKREGEPSIEGQLEEYITNNLGICLADFQTLKDQGFNVNKLGTINTKVSILDYETLILIEYPLEFSKTATKQISKFFVRIPINLKAIYELSKEIVELQKNYRYLEKHLENLIVGYSSVNSNRLPPMYETLLTFGGETTWPIDKVERELKNIITDYTQLLQVSNTANYEPIDTRNSLSYSLYNTGMLIPVQGLYSDLEVWFTYYPDWWPIYFRIDCEGNICKPEPFSNNILTLVGIQKYSFAYDVSFPVEVEIKSPSAFNNRGYSFSFLMESNLRSNEPMPADYLPAPVILAHDSTFCDENKRTSGDITIEVFDADNYKLDNANIIYTCIGEESCNIGKTQDGTLTAKFPPCLGGIISVVKESYLGQSQAFDIDEGTTASLKFQLNPIMIKKFIVKKKMIEKTKVGNSYFWKPTLNVQDLKPNEKAIILLEKIESAQEESFKAGGNYEGNQTEPSEIRIGVGKFEVTINLLLDEKIIIPPTEIGGEPVAGQELPEPYQSGGLITNYTFTYNDLQNYNTIIFYALSPNLYEIPQEARTLKDLTYAQDIQKISQLYWYGAWPKYE